MSDKITAADVRKWKEAMDNKDIPDMSYIDEAMRQIFNDFESQKNELLKKALIEKGFPEYVETMHNRFPKVASQRGYGWTYFFADNGTEEGEFIIAFSDYKQKHDFDTNSVAMYFNHHSDKSLLVK